jgi:L-fuconolactonase
MAFAAVDIHPHIIAPDPVKYPTNPLFGVQSGWSRERPVSIEQFIAAMDEAGVAQAAIVQASTCYGFDNSYLTDSLKLHPGRLTGVGSLDFLAPDAPQAIRRELGKGLTGFRLFTGGSTADFDTSKLDDPRSFPAWEALGELGLPMCLQTSSEGLAQVAGLARRFPRVPILLDHFSRPDISAGPPYAKASSLFALANFTNVYLKLTPRLYLESAISGKATPETFFPKIVEVFGASRIAWGSNFPASAGKLSDNFNAAKKALSCLSDDDQAWIFEKTAKSLYPSLNGN